MRNLIIAILLLGSIVAVWGVFDCYSDKTLARYMDEIDTQVMAQIEKKEWKKAEDDFDRISKEWHEYKKKAVLFLDNETINEADYSIAKAKYYIKAKDDSNAPGELACLKEQLKFLHKNESFSWANIL